MRMGRGNSFPPEIGSGGAEDSNVCVFTVLTVLTAAMALVLVLASH